MNKTINNSLEIIRDKILKLVNSEELYMKTNSYGNEEIEMPNGEKVLKRVEKGKKPMKYGRADWEKSDNIENGHSSRVRVRFVVNELTKLLKTAKILLRENDVKQRESRKKKGEN
jgi:hypothetical protein